MTKSEFVRRMDRALVDIHKGYLSCIIIELSVSYEAAIFYEREFRLFNDHVFWISALVYPLAKNPSREEKYTDSICVRQMLWQWFLDWSIENEYYKGY